MVQYRRSKTPGASYFFTVNLHNRSKGYLTDHSHYLRQAFYEARKIHQFKIVAIAILPDHLHTILQLQQIDYHYPKIWQTIKSRFTRALVKEGVALQKNAKGEYNLWQRRYWEHQIRDETDMQHHIEYIHYNPVKHGHINQVKDWPHSSFHQYVKQDIFPKDWGGEYRPKNNIRYGE